MENIKLILGNLIELYIYINEKELFIVLKLTERSVLI